jgi:hypothetical protein
MSEIRLPYYLGLTLTSRWVGLIFAIDFPRGPRHCYQRLLSLVSCANHKLHLIWGFKVPRPQLWVPLFKPSLDSTYVVPQHVKPGLEPSSTLRFVTQAAMGITLWCFGLGSWLGNPHTWRFVTRSQVPCTPTWGSKYAAMRKELELGAAP